MANVTYSLPLNNPERIADAMSNVFLHLIGWKKAYDIDFISCVRQGQNLDVTFSAAVPFEERQHIKLTIS